MSSWLDVSTGDWLPLEDKTLQTWNDRPASKASLLRAAITPYGYIGRWVLDDSGPVYLDGTYGDAIYLELSEPTVVGWTSRAEAHLQRALAYADPSVKVMQVSAQFSSSDGSEVDGAVIDVLYSADGITENLEVSL